MDSSVVLQYNEAVQRYAFPVLRPNLCIHPSHCCIFAPPPQKLCTCRSKAALAERKRIQDTGGWVSADGRVCDVLAVSRAFGDAEFKGEGLKQLLATGVSERYWTQKFADATRFSSDPVIATPAVTYTTVGEELGDEFIVLASDGLWYVLTLCY
jgi:hypothetical protein